MSSCKDEYDRLEKEQKALIEELRVLVEAETQDKYLIAQNCVNFRRKDKARIRLFICEAKIKNILDEEFSTEITLEERISDKMLYKGITREEAIWDIIKTANKENKDIPTHLILSNPATYRRIE